MSAPGGHQTCPLFYSIPAPCSSLITCAQCAHCAHLTSYIQLPPVAAVVPGARGTERSAAPLITANRSGTENNASAFLSGATQFTPLHSTPFHSSRCRRVPPASTRRSFFCVATLVPVPVQHTLCRLCAACPSMSGHVQPGAVYSIQYGTHIHYVLCSPVCISTVIYGQHRLYTVLECLGASARSASALVVSVPLVSCAAQESGQAGEKWHMDEWHWH